MNGTIITPVRVVSDHFIVVEGNGITALTDVMPELQSGDEVIDVGGNFILPGFIDVHMHGCVGYDTMDASHEAIYAMARYIAFHGTTAYLPTTITASSRALADAITCVRTCQQPKDGAQHLGIHLEGPYINPQYEGVQPVCHIRLPNVLEWQEWLAPGVVKLVTIAPEIPGALEFVRAGVAAGVKFALGHSGASCEEVIYAADCGVTQVSHTFNGMLGFHHRAPGTVGGVLLEDRLYAQIIADGFHVHQKALELIIRVKGYDRVMLITDSLRPTGLPDGLYPMGDEIIIACKNVVRSPDGTLAGTLLTMDRAVQYVVEHCGCSLLEAITMATLVPAKALGLEDCKGMLAVGYDADIVIMDKNFQVRLTMVMGRIIFNNI